MKVEDKDYLKLKLNNLANTCDAIISNIKKLDESEDHYNTIRYTVDIILSAQQYIDAAFKKINDVIIEQDKNKTCCDSQLVSVG